MGFKSRNQIMMEDHYQSQHVAEEIKSTLYELVLESQLDIDQVRATFYDLFSEHDRSMLDGIWDEVMDDLPELN